MRMGRGMDLESSAVTLEDDWINPAHEKLAAPSRSSFRVGHLGFRLVSAGRRGGGIPIRGGMGADGHWWHRFRSIALIVLCCLTLENDFLSLHRVL